MTDQTETQDAETPSAGERRRIVIDLEEYRQRPVQDLPITFHRLELNAILRIYGRMVGEGEWRDYAIDHLPDRAVFSVFRRSGDMPLYRIEKNPKLAQRQGAFSVIGTDGRILKRGHELAQVLKFFDKVQKLRD